MPDATPLALTPVTPILLDTGPSARGAHRLQTALTCPALYAFTRLLKHEAALIDRGPLIRGSIGHAGLAHHYARLGCEQHGLDPETYYPVHTAIDMVSDKFASMGNQFRKLIHDAYIAYQAFYAVERQEVVGVECPVDEMVPTPDGPLRFTQRWDLLTRDDAGRYWIQDHKFCTPGDTEIETEGGVITVEALAERVGPWQATVLTDAGLAWRGATAWRRGIREVYAVVLANGLRLRYGFDHPVLTRRGYVPTADLRPGDEVAVAARLPDRADLDVPDALLTVVGMVLADGCNTNGVVRWYKEDEACRQVYLAALRALDVPHTVQADGEIRGTGLRLQTRLAQVGITPAAAADKIIPRKLTALSARQAAVLLRALWSGDGTCKLKAGTESSVRIVYGSRSLDLCQGIQRLLFQQGILTTVTTSSVAYKGARRPYHFATVVGRESKRAMLDLLGGAPRVGDATQILHAALDRAEAARGATTGKGGGGPSPAREGDVWWVKVVSNLCTGREPVYDVEVQSPEHNYVAAGVVTHNCAKVEQKTVARYALSIQFASMVWLGLHRFGANFGGVKLNLIGVGREGFHFYRPTLPPAPDAVRRFPMTLAFAERRIAAVEALQNPWDAERVYSEMVCVTPYGPCPAFELCRWGQGHLTEDGRTL